MGEISEIHDFANHAGNFSAENSETLDYVKHEAIFLLKSEIRDYANHGGNFFGETSETRDYDNHRPKKIEKNIARIANCHQKLSGLS